MGDDGRCFDRAHTSSWLRGVASIPQELFGDEGTACTRWRQNPRLTIFRVVVVADLAAQGQIPATCRIRNTICDLPLLVFIFTAVPASIISRSQRPDWPVGRWVSYSVKSANFAFCGCSNARFRAYNQLGCGDRVTWRQSSTP